MYEENVAKGAEWLDENFPGWVDKIDLDILNQRYMDKCVLGQIAGAGYWDLTKALRERCGFDLDSTSLGTPGRAEEWAALTDAWRDLIVDRRIGTAVNSWSFSEPVEVSQEGLDKALAHITSVAENADTFVPELTPQGALMHILMDLGIKIKVV